jgi:hypothetical protein
LMMTLPANWKEDRLYYSLQLHFKFFCSYSLGDQ